MGTVVFPGRCSCNDDAVTKGFAAHDPLRLVLCLLPVLGSCLEASSETGSTAYSLTIVR